MMQLVRTGGFRCMMVLVGLVSSSFCAEHARGGGTKRPELILTVGHTAPVTSVALSADGKRVLTGSQDQTAILWYADTAKILQIFKGHWHGVTSVAISADSKHVLTGSWDRTAILWDADSGKPLQTFKGHTEVLHSVAISADAKRVLTGSLDKSAILWNVETGKPIHTIKERDHAIRCLALSADGKRIITGSHDNTPFLWDADTGRYLQAFDGHLKRVQAVAISADGKRALSGSADGSAILWNTLTGKAIQTFAKDAGLVNFMQSVALSADGQRVLITSAGGTAVVWDADTGKSLQTIRSLHKLDDTFFALSMAGKRILTVGIPQKDFRYNAPQLWDADTGTFLQSFRRHFDAGEAAFSEDGKRVLTASLGKTAILWDIEAAKPLQTLIGHTDRVTSVASSADGRRLLTGSEDGTAILWDADTAKRHQTLRHGVSVDSVALSTNGKRILTRSREGAMLWDGDTGVPLHTFKGDFDSSALSGNGKRVLTSPYGKTATLWDAETGKPIHTFVHQKPYQFISFLALSGDGKRALTGSYDESILWNAETAKPLQTFKGDSGSRALALSTDGKQVLTGSNENKNAVLWDADPGKPIQTFLGLNDGIRTVAFSPKEPLLFTASYYDGAVRIWKLGRAEPVFSFLHVDEDWLFWTPEGYYTGSPNGEDLIAWKVYDDLSEGYRIVGPEQFRKQFHRPDLFRHLLRELDLGKALAAADVENSRQPKKPSNIAEAVPPYVIIARPLKSGEIIKTEECEISAKAISVGDNHVASLQLLIDGRPHEGGRTKFIIREPKAGEATATWKANLAPGKRRIQVVAESIKGSTSQSEVIEIIRADEPEALPKLLLLSVGISAYTKADRKGVEYAADDAKRFLEAQLTHSKDLYKDVEKIPLITGDASKADLLDAFDLLSKKARGSKNAVTLIFLAGHGKVSELGDFYFLAADSDPKKLRATAISGAELKDALRNVPGRVVVFLDACHSGAVAGDNFRSPGLTDDLFRDLTSAECGVVIICSSRGFELSQQSNSQKAGLFTLAVVEGLSGKAAKDKSGAVNLVDLFAYVHRRVPALSENRQHPYSSELIKIGNLPLTRP